MKSIALVTNRIKQYFFRNKAIFVLFILGGMLNSIVFAYMYGNLNPAKYKYGWTDTEYREYMVVFNADGDESGSFEMREPERSYVSDEDVQKIIDSELFESVMIRFYNEYTYIGDNVKPDKAVSACVYGEPSIVINTGTGTLSADDQVLVHERSSVPVGSSVNIYGKDFTVVGVYMGGSTVSGYGYIVTENALRQLDLKLNLINAVSVERYHFGKDETDAASDALYEIFPESFVSSPSRFEAKDNRRAEVGIRTARNTFIISTVAFVFLIIYMADSLIDENSISLIVGARPSAIAVSVFWEGFCLSMLAAAAGFAVHILFYDVFFEEINAYAGIEYFVGDYLRVFLIMAIVLAVVMFVVSLKYLFLSPLKLRHINS